MPVPQLQRLLTHREAILGGLRRPEGVNGRGRRINLVGHRLQEA